MLRSRYLPRSARPAWFLLIAIALSHGVRCDAAVENERWVKITAPEFTVITTLREKEAVAWAGEFGQFVAALRGFILINPQRLPRLTLVVFARESDFEPFKPRQENGTVMDVAGFFSRRPSWAVAGLAANGLHDETRTTIFHEGTHWFLSGFELPNPVWLEEGLAEVFSTFIVEGKNVSWGRPIEAHVLTLRQTAPMSLETLLFLARDSLHSEDDNGAERTGLAYAQSWAFVHYLTFGQRDVPKGSLLDYVKRLRATHPDEAFQQAFGASYRDVDKKLTEYLHNGRYYVARQPLATLPPLTAQPASAVEVDDALARLRMAGGRHDAARANVERAVAAAPDNPRVHELQGELAQESGDAEIARAAYAKAVEKGSTDFRPYFELAVFEHGAAREVDGSVRNLTPQTARAIANRYERAINLNPRHRPAYQNLAGLVELVPPGNTEDARFLELGLKLFPDDGMIRLGLAAIAKREGNEEKARTLLAAVLAAPDQPTPVVQYARRIESSWQDRDLSGRVESLAKEKKFAEALALIDAQLAAGVDIATRQRLQAHRNHLQPFLLVEEGRAAMNERRWDVAREKFNAVLASNTSPILKDWVRRQLDQLGKRGVQKKQ